jgi:hypothetical protein
MVYTRVAIGCWRAFVKHKALSSLPTGNTFFKYFPAFPELKNFFLLVGKIYPGIYRLKDLTHISSFLIINPALKLPERD